MMLSSILPALILLSGMLSGLAFKITPASYLIPWLLYALLFLAGISIGSEGVRVSSRDLEVPLAAMVATLISASLIAPVLGIPLKIALSVASGFGWYTLAGPLVTSLMGPEAGTLAFLSNLFRELISLAFHKIIAERVGCNALIACGGAASMDTFLPFVSEACGRESGVKSFISGLVLTLITPLAIKFFASYI